ncbi:TIP-1 family-domain-containing protein [Mrakia frigida]|uniref:TIP-1 family-domain-containing protein n=1 Tax=Mrakia frigida TaxID=29902 RepID=UPI003FCBF3A5
MASSSLLPHLFALPSPSLSQSRAVESISSSYGCWEDLIRDEQLNQDRQATQHELNTLDAKLAESSRTTPIELNSALLRTSSLLASAREVALSRHELADLVAALLGQLEDPLSTSPFKSNAGGYTLLETAELLLVALEESQLGEEYLEVVERLLALSEEVQGLSGRSDPLSTLPTYRILYDFVLRLRSNLPDGSTLPNLAVDLLKRTWSGLRRKLSDDLVLASTQTSWPFKPTTVTPQVDVERFNRTFLSLLALQLEGEKIHRPEDRLGDFFSSGGLYPMEALLEPIKQRWRFHFEGERATNRLDKPEWPFTHLLNLIHDLRPTIVEWIGELLKSGGVEADVVDPLSEFISSLLPLPTNLLLARIPSLLPPQHPALLAHTIHQTLVFDHSIRSEGYDVSKTWAGRRGKTAGAKEWEGLAAGVVLGREDWFRAWIDGEKEFSLEEYGRITNSQEAWKILDSFELEIEMSGVGGAGDDSDDDEKDASTPTEDRWRPTRSSLGMIKLLGQITDRYSPLPSPQHRFLFFTEVQLPLLVAYSSRISSSLNAFERLASSFAKIVPGALAGHASNPNGMAETTALKGVQGLGSLCKALVSVRWVMKGLEGWGDEMFFVQLWADINSDASLRVRTAPVEGLPALSAGGLSAIEGTIFDSQISTLGLIAARTEEMLVKHVCHEVEHELKAHLSRRWDAPAPLSTDSEDQPTLPPTLLTPLTILSTHLTYLSTLLPPSTYVSATLYRSIVSHLSYHIIQRAVKAGWSKFSEVGGKEFESEVQAWIESSRIGLRSATAAKGAGRGGKGVERPWRKMREMGTLVGLPAAEKGDGEEGMRFREVVELMQDGGEEDEKKVRKVLDVKELTRAEILEVLKRRLDY